MTCPADPVDPDSTVGTIVLTGGRGSRLGGVDKAAITIDDVTMLQHILDLAPAPVMVVGGKRPLPAGVLWAQEEPPGGGPAAGVAAGVRAWAADKVLPSWLFILAVDQAGLTAVTLDGLLRAAHRAGGAVLATGGRRHYGIACVRAAALRAVVVTQDWSDRPLRTLLDPLIGEEVVGESDAGRDVDTMDDLEHFGGVLPRTRPGGAGRRRKGTA